MTADAVTTGRQDGADGPPPALSPKARMRRRLWRRFRSRPMAVIGLALSLAFVLVAVFAPWLAPYPPGASNFDAILTGPSAAHPFGTDELGRDTLSRVIHGARASIQAGVLATLLAMLVAVPLGLLAGYYRGFLDSGVMRITDTLLAFPFIIQAVLLAAILGPSLLNATIAIGISQVPQLIRITRGEVLGVSEEDYIGGAVANGATDTVVLRRHVFPNIMNTLLVQATVIIPAAIIAESILSFLGLGVQPPTPSWGVMLSAAQPFLAQAPLLSLFPGLAIFFATLSVNLLGDGLRDVLDPKAVS
jgi:peptide/nickel transport system permease protein